LLSKSLKYVEKNPWLKLPWSWKKLLWKMNTLSQENCIQMSIFTVDSFTERWDSQLTCTRFSSQFQESLDGSLTGLSSWMIHKITFTGQDKIMSDMVKESSYKCQKERTITLISKQLARRKIREDKQLKNWLDLIQIYNV